MPLPGLRPATLQHHCRAEIEKPHLRARRTRLSEARSKHCGNTDRRGGLTCGSTSMRPVDWCAPPRCTGPPGPGRLRAASTSPAPFSARSDESVLGFRSDCTAAAVGWPQRRVARTNPNHTPLPSQAPNQAYASFGACEQKQSACRQKLGFRPKVAPAVWTGCQSFGSNNHLIQKLKVILRNFRREKRASSLGRLSRSTPHIRTLRRPPSYHGNIRKLLITF